MGGHDLCNGLIGNYVVGGSALDAYDPDISRLFNCHISDQVKGDDSLLGIDGRKIGVRGKAGHRRRLLLEVMLYIGASRLLAAAEDDPDPLAEGEIGIAHSLEGIERCHSRTLIVYRPPAIDPAVVNLGPVGGIPPALSLRHHIQMGQDGHIIISLAVLGVAYVAVQVLGGKAEIRGHLQGFGQGSRRALSEGSVGLGIFSYALDLHQLLGGVNDLRSVLFHQDVQLCCYTFVLRLAERRMHCHQCQ